MSMPHRKGAICRALPLPLAVLLLAACVASTSPGGKLQPAASTARVNELALQSGLDWARIRGHHRMETWTIDGPALNRLVIVTRIKPGEHVFLQRKERRSRPDGPWYRSRMRPDELRDLVVDGLREGGWADIETPGLRPASFGGVPGLRFELEMASSSGLRYGGMAAAAEFEGKLYLLLWMAPREHYHDRDAAAVAAMFDHLRFVRR
ncbi:hypothetical protein [Arenimonas fontis]|uniref:Lipoprotein n=1 Tax=Arenimonas fontis TaxID=2608255 RepID=A0A5B2ZGZ7_9GAMM|nr:hypothetical protein [Arenimonas fontis]KAA2286312.1 hypothetical protein F0415_02100 [Arenimonas fontis]